MLGHPDIISISIYAYKWVILLSFMLSCGVYITRPLKWVKVEEKSTFNVSFSQGKHRFSIIKFQGNVANIYVRNFGKCLQYWGLMYIQKIYPTLLFSFSNMQLDNILMKHSDIYVSITGYLLRIIYIHRFRENIQHSMLVHPDFKYISIDT